TIGTRWCGYRSSSRRPTSEREITAVSMKNGWRCSSRAQRAPAYPDAPNTATLGVTDPPLQLRGQGCPNFAPPRGHLLIGERSVGRAKTQAQRQRYVSGADALLVTVDVEHLRAGEQRSAGGARHGQHLAGTHRVAHDHREVFANLRKAREVLVEGEPHVCRRQIEVHLECRHRIGPVPG